MIWLLVTARAIMAGATAGEMPARPMVMRWRETSPHLVVGVNLDGTFIGTTTGDHRMALSPPEGRHRLTLTDGNGHVLHRHFTVVGGAANNPPKHAR